MIIPINLSPPTLRLPNPLEPALAKLGSNEVVLIELQGWLDVVEGEKENGFIGNLTMVNVCIVCVSCPWFLYGFQHHLSGQARS